jgi:serine/threonine protein kinase
MSMFAPDYKYVNSSPLGQGAMGAVFKARNSQLSRWVPLKFFSHGSKDLAARFEREGVTMAGLSHPSLLWFTMSASGIVRPSFLWSSSTDDH